MQALVEQITALKKKLTRKTCIALTWDKSRDGLSEDYKTVIYKSHDDEGITIVDENDDVIYLDETWTEYIKGVSILKKDFKAKIKSTKEYRSPKTLDRHVGIELEFVSKLSNAQIVMALVAVGVEDYITVKEDGSIETDDDSDFTYTHEVCVLAKESEFASVIRKIANALKGNSTINESCGMHVHIDMRSRNPDMSYAALFEAQPILYAMCPKSRRTGTYSKPETRSSMMTNDCDGGRYFGINKTSYLAHRTIEVRVHSGTLHADKIINWVNILLKIVNSVKMYHSNPDQVRLQKSLKEFKKRIKLRGKLSTYVDQRIEKFKTDHTRIDAELALTA